MRICRSNRDGPQLAGVELHGKFPETRNGEEIHRPSARCEAG